MSQGANFKHIDVRAARQLLSRGEVLLLDMRDKASFEIARIEGARHISDRNIHEFLSATPKATPVLIYCYHGNASQVYAQTFADFRFTDVSSLDGGYEAWAQALAASQTTGVSLSIELQDWLEGHGFPRDGVNATTVNAMTPLMRASRLGPASIVSDLLAAGAQLEARNSDGNTALWLACVGEDLRIVDMLISAGINIDNVNDNDATCLMYAASTGKARVVEKLLSAGADISRETLDGFTATDVAATIDCLRLLRKAQGAIERAAF